MGFRIPKKWQILKLCFVISFHLSSSLDLLLLKSTKKNIFRQKLSMVYFAKRRHQHHILIIFFIIFLRWGFYNWTIEAFVLIVKGGRHTEMIIGFLWENHRDRHCSIQHIQIIEITFLKNVFLEYSFHLFCHFFSKTMFSSYHHLKRKIHWQQ